MKTEKNILIAFLLNLLFSLIEFIGGLFTNSIAIISDSIHDMGDAMSIGISYLLERKGAKLADDKYTYGYVRYSVLGSIITTFILLGGSVLVIYNSLARLLNPVEINYNGMIVFAILGVIINFLAAYFTKEGHSLNQKSVNLHMLEDVLGWVIVLIGAIIMRFTDINLLDSILSIVLALFIFINALKNLKEIINIFVEKVPDNIDIKKIKECLIKIDGVIDVHHIHVRSIDGFHNYATMHVVTDANYKEIKQKVKQSLLEYGIIHTTIELEDKDEKCVNQKCVIQKETHSHHNHHHHN